MNEGCFQSASSCGKYPYIGDLHLQKFLILGSLPVSSDCGVSSDTSAFLS